MLAWRLSQWVFPPDLLGAHERRMLLATGLGSVLDPPHGIEEDLRKTLLYWADFAGVDVRAITRTAQGVSADLREARAA